MVSALLRKVVGTKNERTLKKFQGVVDAINELEGSIALLTDAELASKTTEFKQRHQDGESLDSLMPEAFAVVREASVRVLGMRHFDVQLIGGMVLHSGKIAEMKTGEGKTLMSTLPVYLNALSGKGVHVVTVNDYLAMRDAEWMGKVYSFLGLTVGCVVHGLDDQARQHAYNCDITYGTNNEFGFDYLRDNMKFDAETFVQRELSYAIVDEVDSILIDEARTPLIISGPSEATGDAYRLADQIVRKLKRGKVEEDRGSMGRSEKTYSGDYVVDEKDRTVVLTEDGISSVEELLQIENLYDPQHISLIHFINQALSAHEIYKLDVDYVVKDGEVIIVDEFTGRLMPGRRWGDGQHQAVEAKEGLKVENENQTLASITFQNYFRMYDKLSGMTGTADTEAVEFASIYGLEIVVIPTHRPMARVDNGDVIYKTKEEKVKAIIRDIIEKHETGQPVLVGTISIEDSEMLSKRLKKQGIKHNVLNAKQHDKEAEVVAQAGRKGAVTIATNMAGRGTDIVLGGNPEMLAEKEMRSKGSSGEVDAELLEHYVKSCAAEKEEVLAAGGLYILGTERHESRRIDNQLRGRSGRQGDPGESRFYLSLDDDLMRIFGAEQVSRVMDRLKVPDDEPIEHGLISRVIEGAQKRVESHNYEIRKHLIDYDDVMNRQREVIYKQRRELLSDGAMVEMITDVISESIEAHVGSCCPKSLAPHEWDQEGLLSTMNQLFNIEPDLPEFERGVSPSDVLTAIEDQVMAAFNDRLDEFSAPVMENLVKVLFLQSIDSNWQRHLLAIDQLKEGIGMRAYAQKNPKEEYKREAYGLFVEMMDKIRSEVLHVLFRVRLQEEEPAPKQQVVFGRRKAFNPELKVGRNEPCPCESGKKYKRCCGV